MNRSWFRVRNYNKISSRKLLIKVLNNQQEILLHMPKILANQDVISTKIQVLEEELKKIRSINEEMHEYCARGLGTLIKDLEHFRKERERSDKFAYCCLGVYTGLLVYISMA